jgi:hypothetical protein
MPVMESAGVKIKNTIKKTNFYFFLFVAPKKLPFKVH